MEIVSNRSEEEIAAKRVSEELSWATRNLVANILRIMADAGELHRVLEQVVAFSEPVKQLHKLQRLPFEQIEKDLCSWRKEHLSLDDLERAVTDAEDAITKYAFRVVAARLLSQRTQESQAHHRLYQALFEWREAQEERKVGRRKPAAD